MSFRTRSLLFASEKINLSLLETIVCDIRSLSNMPLDFRVLAFKVMKRLKKLSIPNLHNLRTQTLT